MNVYWTSEPMDVSNKLGTQMVTHYAQGVIMYTHIFVHMQLSSLPQSLVGPTFPQTGFVTQATLCTLLNLF